MTSVPMSEFGRDHWSTFAYAECRIVDNDGMINKNHMRCNWARHPLFRHPGCDAVKYPTRLKDGVERPDHDDWDCLDDLEQEQLLVNVGTGMNRVYELTDLGRVIAAQLRAHMAKVKGVPQGKFDTFVPVLGKDQVL